MVFFHRINEVNEEGLSIQILKEINIENTLEAVSGGFFWATLKSVAKGWCR